jgi:hypothetical protein
VTLDYAVDADIARASTLPSAFYRDPAAWEAVRERGVHHFHRLLCEHLRMPVRA